METELYLPCPNCGKMIDLTLSEYEEDDTIVTELTPDVCPYCGQALAVEFEISLVKGE